MASFKNVFQYMEKYGDFNISYINIIRYFIFFELLNIWCVYRLHKIRVEKVESHIQFVSKSLPVTESSISLLFKLFLKNQLFTLPSCISNAREAHVLADFFPDSTQVPWLLCFSSFSLPSWRQAPGFINVRKQVWLQEEQGRRQAWGEGSKFV